MGLYKKSKPTRDQIFSNRQKAWYQSNWILGLITCFPAFVLTVFLISQYGNEYCPASRFVIIASIPAGLTALCVIIETIIFATFFHLLRKIKSIGKINMNVLKARFLVWFIIKMVIAIATIVLRIILVLSVLKNGNVRTLTGFIFLAVSGFFPVVYWVPIVVIAKTLNHV